MQKRDQHAVLDTSTTSRSPQTVVSDILPWVSDVKGRILAGHFRRVSGEAECWCLPDYVDDPHAWIIAALTVWNQRDHVRFPQVGDWRGRTRWRTGDERRLGETVDALVRERDAAMLTFIAQESQLRASLDAARDRADNNERLLLTAKSRQLVDVVSEALCAIGFEVEDMDRVWPTGKKREDLRLRDPGTPGWAALVEVRGLSGGGAASDLQRIERFKRLYKDEEGQLPTQSWYIVNQFIDVDPDDRERLFASNPSDVEVFAEEGGLVIDTRVLFHIWIDVQTGDLTQDAARDSMKSQTGVLLYLPQAAG
jgi:hypothetical protein